MLGLLTAVARPGQIVDVAHQHSGAVHLPASGPAAWNLIHNPRALGIVRSPRWEQHV
jgi:hypothetical protein